MLHLKGGEEGEEEVEIRFELFLHFMTQTVEVKETHIDVRFERRRGSASNTDNIQMLLHLLFNVHCFMEMEKER